MARRRRAVGIRPISRFASQTLVRAYARLDADKKTPRTYVQGECKHPRYHLNSPARAGTLCLCNGRTRRPLLPSGAWLQGDFGSRFTGSRTFRPLSAHPRRAYWSLSQLFRIQYSQREPFCQVGFCIVLGQAAGAQTKPSRTDLTASSTNPGGTSSSKTPLMSVALTLKDTPFSVNSAE